MKIFFLSWSIDLIEFQFWLNSLCSIVVREIIERFIELINNCLVVVWIRTNKEQEEKRKEEKKKLVTHQWDWPKVFLNFLSFFFVQFENQIVLKMSFVQVSGRIGFISLWISLLSYFLSFIFYLLSFFLIDWIIYQPISIKIGIWRLCDIQVKFIFFKKKKSWINR